MTGGIPREPGVKRTALAVALGLMALFAAAKSTTSTAEHLKDAAIADYIAQARADAAAGRYERASRDYRLALTLNAGDAEVRLGLAGALLHLGNWPEAEGHLGQLRTTDPANSEVNLLSARAAVAAQNLDAASDYYHRAVYGYWTPGNLSRRLSVRFEMVRLLAQRGDTDSLVPELIRLQREAPDTPEVRKEIAGLMVRAGMLQQAAVEYRSLIARGVRDRDVVVPLAEANLQMGNYSQTVQSMREQLRSNPGDAASAQLLALAERALELDPGAGRTTLAQRHRRSALLIDAVLGYAEACGGLGQIASLADGARREAGEPYRAATADAALERNVQTASRLWHMLPERCRSNVPRTNPLPLVFRSLEGGAR